MYMQTDQVPRPLGRKQHLNNRFIGTGAAIAGLIAGKNVYDGPIFDETVSLYGKTAVITGANTGLGKGA